MNITRIAMATAALAIITVAGEAAARDQIRIVGSSTVFPFSTAVAERFGKTTSFKTPVVESTGSGGGLKLFCAGVGVDTPDITNASRRMKPSEFKTCQKNGVDKIVEVVAGFDGIVVANAIDAADFSLTRAQIFLALAAKVPADSACTMVPNPNVKWSDVDPALPDQKIEVLGPPPTSGTRDAFEDLAMEGGAKNIPCLAALRKTDKKAFVKIATTVRTDGAYIEAGENDNLIVSKLEANHHAVGVFGFSFLDQNSDQIKGASVDGVKPAFEVISDGKYPLSRSLYFYIKKAHVGAIPGIVEYAAEFTSDGADGEDGYLIDKGLIPLPADKHKANKAQAANLVPMSIDVLN